MSRSVREIKLHNRFLHRTLKARTRNQILWAMSMARSNLSDLRRFMKGLEKSQVDHAMLYRMQRRLGERVPEVIPSLLGESECIALRLKQELPMEHGRWFNSSNSLNVWTWVTPTLHLRGIECGPFLVRIPWHYFEFPEREIRIHITNLNPLESHGGYPHPHVGNDGFICLGSNTQLIRNMAKLLDLRGIRQAVEDILEEYNEDSPYIKLEVWNGEVQTCDRCEDPCDPEDLISCTACESLVCPSCRNNCALCMESFCSEHLSRCPLCGHLVCESCFEFCDMCGDYVCSHCMTSCEHCDIPLCSACVHSDNLCSDCHDKSLKQCSECGVIGLDVEVRGCSYCGEWVCQQCGTLKDGSLYHPECLTKLEEEED